MHIEVCCDRHYTPRMQCKKEREEVCVQCPYMTCQMNAVKIKTQTVEDQWMRDETDR